MMLPRLVLRLDEAIASESRPLERECLKAERAGVLARLGRMPEARFALSGLRSQAQRLKSPRLQAWIWLVDGLISHFESVDGGSRAKFERALALAEAAVCPPLEALASSWLSAWAFNAMDLPGMSRHLARALQLAAPDHHAVQARVGLVLADAFRFAGDEALSRQWYQFSRRHAGDEGDTSMMSFLLYNMAAMRAARIGLEDALGQANADEVRQAQLEVQSTLNYDQGTGAAALAATLQMVKAQLAMVRGEHAEALALYDLNRAAAVEQGSGRRDGRFLAERAWCEMRLGRVDAARREARLAEAALSDRTDADDRVAAHARLATLLGELGDTAAKGRHQQALARAQQDHAESQRAMREALVAGLRAAGRAEDGPPAPAAPLRTAPC